jgi:hypothetical protein
MCLPLINIYTCDYQNDINGENVPRKLTLHVTMVCTACTSDFDVNCPGASMAMTTEVLLRVNSRTDQGVLLRVNSRTDPVSIALAQCVCECFFCSSLRSRTTVVVAIATDEAQGRKTNYDDEKVIVSTPPVLDRPVWHSPTSEPKMAVGTA